MRAPLSWLNEFVDLDLPLDELIETMGRYGLEVEEVRRPGAGVTGVRVARIVDVHDHPEADRLIVVRVDDGDGERTVCAGARNVTVGDLVPLAAPGATLPDGDGGTIEIGRREMRGVESDGMLCSPRELEVADDHSGILVLDPETLGGASPGADVHDVLPLGEPVIEVAVPADRGDLLSIHGIARDLAAILDVPMREPASHAVTGEFGEVPIRVDAAAGCRRYVGWVVTELEVRPSPWWLRRRLEVCGVRSLANLVDVTNYVMVERGQPLHAFDLDRLRGPAVVVRWAEPGEQLVTLDGRQRRLEPTDLVIADEERAVALAGVMGGEDSEVGATTTRVLLESAAFDPATVRRTARRIGLQSEASARFERGVDPDGTWQSAARAVDLLGRLAGGHDAGVRAAGPGTADPAPIDLDPDRVAGLLGLDDLGGTEQRALLERAGVAVQTDGGRLVATPPTWRGDLQRPADLAEEIARLYGYEHIPATVPSLPVVGGRDRRQRAEGEVRTAVLAAGFHEVQTYPFVADDAPLLLVPEDAAHGVRLENPIRKDAGTMRASLLSGLLEVARVNAGQGRGGLAVFELGRIFRASGGALAGLLERTGWASWSGPEGQTLPAQPLALGLLAYGVRGGRGWVDRSRTWDLFHLLGALDEVVARLAPEPGSWRLERVPTERADLHPGRTAALRWQGEEIAIVGQLHPGHAADLDLPDPTLVGELLLDPLWAHLAGDGPEPRAAVPLPRHPAVTVDVAVVAEDTVPYAEIEAAVRTGAGALLDDLAWFDEFRGEQLGEGRRSLAFNLRLQHPERQLTDADAEAVVEGVAREAERRGATLRRG